MSASVDFVRADSTNLPDVDIAVITEYLRTSDKHNIAEIRGVKALMASRTGYVQHAVGYVEVKRDDTDCIVRAKIVPEHKITKKYYVVTVSLNEKESSIIDTNCDGCPASQGGCKHTLVLLYWLDRKSTEPSPTSVECYWKKPRLASEGTNPTLIKDLVKPTKGDYTVEPSGPEKLIAFYEECKKRNVQNCLLLSFLPDYDRGLGKYCLFDMVLDFTTKTVNHDYDNFKTCMSPCLDKSIITHIESSTKQQAESNLWHSIRQGRITASKVYEVCHCKTPDGALVEQILGGYKFYETEAMKRGKVLEKSVIREMENKLKCNIQNCGFSLINLICGASPDGVAHDFIVEVKCPSTKKSVKNYIKGKKIGEKYIAQCQLQMLATGYKKCAFCVADPEFENNKKIQIIWIKYDTAYAKKLIIQSEVFWKKNIYPKILNNAKS